MKIFWSWQSDTPGKIGRHFVRGCLSQAITRLKESEDLSEPTEREARDALHLDHDRLGISGSPDLASVIFSKIDAAEVFIADVTPVSTIVSKKQPDGTRSRQKRNMNPNVAIELGYALKASGTEAVLMVLNEHYGKREHLPFDLAHKAGPLRYRLGPEASKDQVDAQRKELTAQLVDALRPFLSRQAVHQPKVDHDEVPFVGVTGVFFEAYQPLATTENWSNEIVRHIFPAGPTFYLRVLPVEKIAYPFSKSALVQAARNVNLSTLTRAPGGGTVRPNQYGAIVFEDQNANEGSIERATQIFSNGELWGFSNDLVRRDRLIVATAAVEDMYERSLFAYLSFAQDHLKLGARVRVIAGGVGLENYKLATRDPYGSYLQLHGSSFQFSAIVPTEDNAAQRAFLKDLFVQMWDLSGTLRPESPWKS